MARVIVTVQRAGDPRTRELEVSASIPGTRLAELIARALGWDQDPSGDRAVFQIEALPLGRRLSFEESLASAGAWDGSWLILHQIGAEPRPLPAAPPPPVPAYEQVWDPAIDPPTDIGFGWSDPPTPPDLPVPPAAPAPPEVAPLRLDPHIGWRGTRLVRAAHPAQPPAASIPPPPPAAPPPPEPLAAPSLPESLAAPSPAPLQVPRSAELPPGPEVMESPSAPAQPPTAPAPAPLSPASTASLPILPTPTVAPASPAAEPESEGPLRGFRPWRSRRQAEPAAPSSDDPAS